MFLEALEILSSAGEDQNTYVTDFGVYKVIYILTVYVPFVTATLLLSQEYLGDKIKCFAPDSFSEPQADALNEHCWTNGFWVSEGSPLTKRLFTQPHRFFPYYLPIQAVLFTIPVVLWNVLTKQALLAMLKGTEEFLEELLGVLQGKVDDVEDRDVISPSDSDYDSETENDQRAEKAKTMLWQYHDILLNFIRTTDLASCVFLRLVVELVLCVFVIMIQPLVYNSSPKYYHCEIPEMIEGNVRCTLGSLDLMDMIWSINYAALLLAFTMLVGLMVYCYWRLHSKDYVHFYEGLPYTSKITKTIAWQNNTEKFAYELLGAIFEGNNAIMTQVYILASMKPPSKQQKQKMKDMTKAARRVAMERRKLEAANDSSTDDEEASDRKVTFSENLQVAPSAMAEPHVHSVHDPPSPDIAPAHSILISHPPVLEPENMGANSYPKEEVIPLEEAPLPPEEPTSSESFATLENIDSTTSIDSSTSDAVTKPRSDSRTVHFTEDLPTLNHTGPEGKVRPSNLEMPTVTFIESMDAAHHADLGEEEDEEEIVQLNNSDSLQTLVAPVRHRKPRQPSPMPELPGTPPKESSHDSFFASSAFL